MAEITPEEYESLLGIGEAIKDGETTWEVVAKTGAPAPRRGVPHVKDVQQGYGEAAAVVERELKKVETEVITEIKAPLAGRPMPPDPYEENLALDQQLAEEE